MIRPFKLSDIFRRRHPGQRAKPRRSSSRRGKIPVIVPLWFVVAAFAAVTAVQKLPSIIGTHGTTMIDGNALLAATTQPAEKTSARHPNDHFDPCSNPHAFPSGPSNSGRCIDVSWMSGEALFRTPLPGSNGRSCASCHVPKDNFTLTPEHVATLLARNPNDPLFNRIDADDPNADTLTFEHLKKGLIRVGLTLPQNVDLIDEAGNVTTPPDRMIYVWRSVPSVADSVLTAPYQLDGRERTLERQAQGAITSHSEAGAFPSPVLRRIADFQRRVFTSDRSRRVAHGAVGDVEDRLVLNAEETRGRRVYQQVCEACHGGSNKTTIVDRVVHDTGFPALRPDGTVIYRTDAPLPVLASQPTNEFMNVATSFETYLALIDATSHEHFSKDVGFPTFRFRFYKDASRRQVIAELPPALPNGDPLGDIPLDENDNPIVGPNFTLQAFTTDPGRAAITGNPYDFEAFDIPTLRGIAKTAPYFHDNSAKTLEEAINVYNDHLLSRFPTLTINDAPPPDDPGLGGVDAMSEQQMKDLLAFLRRL